MQIFNTYRQARALLAQSYAKPTMWWQIRSSGTPRTLLITSCVQRLIPSTGRLSHSRNHVFTSSRFMNSLKSSSARDQRQHASRVELNIIVKQNPLEEGEHSEPGAAKIFRELCRKVDRIPNISSSLNLWCLDKQLFSDHLKVEAGLSLDGVKSSANEGKLQVYDH